MTTQLNDWERSHYAPGGGDPWLFYVVFGAVDASASLSRSAYRTNGPPDGIDLMSYGPGSHPEVPATFRSDWIWDEFVANEPEAAARVASCDSCVVLRGTPTEVTTLNYLRDTVGVITWMLDHGGCAVYEPQMFRWWNPATWKADIFDPAAAVPRHHVVILVSEEDDPSKKWFHTRGMRKFGRPDISVHNVGADMEAGVIDLCNRLIEHQAFGLLVPDGHELRMANLPPGGVFRYGGDVDDPDYNNVHLDVIWPGNKK